MLDYDEVARTLEARPHRAIDLEELRPSAVVLPLFVRGGEHCLLFTRRTLHLHHHRGEISFPGGRADEEDADLVQTALRETEEEMGILPEDLRVLGRLDDFVSVQGYHVVPYVAAFDYPYPFRVNEEEIAEVIEVPLRRLLDPAIFRRENWRHRGRVEPVLFYSLEEAEIWGLTAAILHQFLSLFFGNEGPVAGPSFVGKM